MRSMSANWDRNQKIQFYFGNAAKDLADYLPPEEKAPRTAVSDTDSDLAHVLSNAEAQLLRIQNAQKEISFLLSDLKRMIG